MDPTRKDPTGHDLHRLRRDEWQQRDRRDPRGRQTSGQRERQRERPARGGPDTGGDPLLRGGGRPDRRFGDDRRPRPDIPGRGYEASYTRPDRPIRPDDRGDTARGERGASRGGRATPPGDYAQPQRHPSAAPRAQRRPGRAGPPTGQPRGPRPTPLRFQSTSPDERRGAARGGPPRQRLGAWESPSDNRDSALPRGDRYRGDGPLQRKVRRSGPRRDDGPQQGTLRRDARRGDWRDRRLSDDTGG